MADHPVGAAFAGVVLFVVGLGIGGGALEMNRRERQQFSGWIHTQGTVVPLPGAADTAASGHGPLVAFTTAAGERVSFTAASGAAGKRQSGTVPVLYPAGQPMAAIVDPRGRRWTRNAGLTVASLFLMILGAYVAWYARQWDARARDVER